MRIGPNVYQTKWVFDQMDIKRMGIRPKILDQMSIRPNGYQTKWVFDQMGIIPNGMRPNGFRPNGFRPNGFRPNGYQTKWEYHGLVAQKFGVVI